MKRGIKVEYLIILQTISVNKTKMISFQQDKIIKEMKNRKYFLEVAPLLIRNQTIHIKLENLIQCQKNLNILDHIHLISIK